MAKQTSECMFCNSLPCECNKKKPIQKSKPKKERKPTAKPAVEPSAKPSVRPVVPSSAWVSSNTKKPSAEETPQHALAKSRPMSFEGYVDYSLPLMATDEASRVKTLRNKVERESIENELSMVRAMKALLDLGMLDERSKAKAKAIVRDSQDKQILESIQDWKRRNGRF